MAGLKKRNTDEVSEDICTKRVGYYNSNNRGVSIRVTNNLGIMGKDK